MNSKFFPYLKPIAAKENLYYIDLFFEENSKEKVPIITFVSEDDKHIESLDDHGLSGSQLVKNSFKNLIDVEVDWVRQDYGDDCILSIENDKFASEKILDKSFLQKAAAQLNTNRIKVAVPVRNAILICDANKETSVKILNRELHKLYNDFSREMISRLIFEVEDGIIKSADMEEVSLEELKTIEDIPASYRVDATKSKLFGELYNIKLMAGADNMEDFQNGIFHSIQKTIIGNVNKKDFNQTIEILSEIKRPEMNAENVLAIQDFFARLKANPVIKKMVKNVKKPLKVSFMFSADFRNGDTHKKIITFLN